MNTVDNIISHIYPFIIKDWKNTSLIVNKSNKNNKAFNEVLKSLIFDASQKAELYFSNSSFTLFEKTLLENSNINNKSLILDIHQNLKTIMNQKQNFNMDEFLEKASLYLSNNYYYINAIKPQGWEQFILSHKKNTINLGDYFKNISPLRKSSFKGFNFKDGNLEFYDSISLQCTAAAFFEEDIQPYKILFASVIAYTFKYHEYYNSLQLESGIIELSKLDKVSSLSLKTTFKNYIGYDEKKVNFEIIEENKKKKSDLDRILNKLNNI